MAGEYFIPALNWTALGLTVQNTTLRHVTAYCQKVFFRMAGDGYPALCCTGRYGTAHRVTGRNTISFNELGMARISCLALCITTHRSAEQYSTLQGRTGINVLFCCQMCIKNSLEIMAGVCLPRPARDRTPRHDALVGSASRHTTRQYGNIVSHINKNGKEWLPCPILRVTTRDRTGQRRA